MTLLNAHVVPDRALVAVDTASSIGGRMCEVSKAFALPHLPAVLAGRGSLATLAGLASQLAILQSIEEASSWLDENLARVRAGIQQAYVQCGIDPERELEVVLVGYSAARRCMTGTAWLREGGDEFRSYEITDGFPWIAPWDDAEQGEPIVPDTPERAVELMEQQVRDAARYTGAVVGGRAVIYEITPNGVHIMRGAPLRPGAPIGGRLVAAELSDHGLKA
jgi:hypothetical protein